MRAITAPSGRAPRPSTRSATSSDISSARSSTSPRRCCVSRRNARTNPGLTPLERGQLLHGVFEAFYRGLARARPLGGHHRRSRGGARRCSRRWPSSSCSRLPEGDRALERTYLLGSAASPGLAERAFAVEIEQGIGVVERLLEYEFEGPFNFEKARSAARVAVRGKVDRIDCSPTARCASSTTSSGARRRPARALQLPIYGSVRAAGSRSASAAARCRWPAPATSPSRRRTRSSSSVAGPATSTPRCAKGRQRFLDAVARIERGEYPPDPDEPWTCTRCGFPHVCRKDYVGDE